MQQPKPIAPTALSAKDDLNTANDCVTSSTIVNRNSSMRCRKKIVFHPTLGYAIPAPQPAKVARRNARERNRVKQVNSGFEILRTHIPSAAKQKKMSKVETLRHAVEYIQCLQQMLVEQEQQKCAIIPAISDSNSLQSPLPLSNSQQQTTVPPSPYNQLHFQYPSPMTPRTPTTPKMMTPECNFDTANNESGYETSSYYSSSLMSPRLHHESYNSIQHHPDTYSPTSSVSSNEHTNVQQTNEYILGNTYSHQQQGDFYHNSEEDELLDVIAKWQDQDE